MAKQRIRPEEEVHREERDLPKRKPRPSLLIWFGSRLLVLLVLVGVLAFFAPMLVGATGVWKSVLASSAPKLADKLDVASLSLGWFAKIELKGVAVRDAAGQPLAQIARISSRKTLLEIALNYHDLGTFDIEEPRAKVVLRADGSNVEDFLALLPKSESQSPPTQIGLAIAKGNIEFDDTLAQRQWLLSGVNLDLLWTATADQPKTGKLAAAVAPLTNAVSPAGTAAQVAVEFSWLPPADGKGALGAGQAQLMLNGVPTELCTGALRRFVGDIRPAGPITLDATYVWAQDGQSQQVAIKKLTTPGLQLAAPQWLAADQPAIAIASGQGDVQLSQGKATIRNLQLVSSVMQLRGDGQTQLAALTSGDVELAGQINLAELCRQLPATLRLKQETQLAAGELVFSLSSKQLTQARAWQGGAEIRGLKAAVGGRPVEFQQPLVIELAAQQQGGNFAISKLAGRGDFFELNGSGTLATGQIKADADLSKLATQLGQFIDLGNTRLAGKLSSDIHWSETTGQGWLATANADVQNFELLAAGLAPWNEADLKLMAEVRGALGSAGLERIDAAKLAVVAGNDQLSAELVEPVATPSAATVWPAKFSLKGDLATWTPRLQPFVPLGDLRMAGAIDATGSGKFSPQAVELAQTTVSVDPLAVDGAGLSIRDKLRIETAGAWDQQRLTLTLGPTTFATYALAFRADGLRLIAGTEPSVVGTIDLRSDLSKLHSWLATGGQPRTSVLSGGLTGRMEIGYRGQTLAASWQTDVENFALLVAPTPSGNPTTLAAATNAPWQPLLPPERINLTGQGSYDPKVGTLTIERTALSASTLSLATAGAVRNLTTTPEVDLTGEIAYDLSRLAQQIQAFYAKRNASGVLVLPYGLNTLQLTGNERRQFALKGPLFAAATTGPNSAGSRGFGIADSLTGEASLGWQGAQYVGLVAGASDFRAKLAGGVVNVGPLDIPLSEGRLTTAPRLSLNSPQPAVVIERGPLIQNVRISPEMCSLWLKFVAPLVAEATRAEGQFSLSLEGASVPLSDPMTSDVSGTLAIKQAQIGPGPLAQQYLGLAQQLRSFFDANAAAAPDPNRGWLILPQQDVTFDVRQGFVHHRGLKMTVKDVVITTEGSVGIETQQINLVASIPVQESWLKNDKKFAFLKGQTIQVPIRGTLSSPQLDARVLENLGKQLVGQAVQGQVEHQVERGQQMLQKQLGNGLNKLFGPLQPQPQPAVPQPAPMPR